MIELPVEIKGRYSHAYPLSEAGHLLCELANKKTITKDMLPILTKMGYKVIDKTPRKEFN